MQDVIRLKQQLAAMETGKVSKPSFAYFDIIGIAWPYRCLLQMSGDDYDDIRIPLKAWAAKDEQGNRLIKGDRTSLHVPLYADADVVITQSIAIAHYLAHKYDMAGNGAAEQLQFLEITNHCHDALFHWCGILPILLKRGTDEQTVQDRMAAFMGKGKPWGLVTHGFDMNLQGFENYLNRNPHDSGFMIGESLTFADLHSFNVLCHWFKAFNPEAFARYPLLDDYIRRLATLPAVANGIAEHQGLSTWLPMPTLATNLYTAEELIGLV